MGSQAQVGSPAEGSAALAGGDSGSSAGSGVDLEAFAGSPPPHAPTSNDTHSTEVVRVEHDMLHRLTLTAGGTRYEWTAAERRSGGAADVLPDSLRRS